MRSPILHKHTHTVRTGGRVKVAMGTLPPDFLGLDNQNNTSTML